MVCSTVAPLLGPGTIGLLLKILTLIARTSCTSPMPPATTSTRTASVAATGTPLGAFPSRRCHCGYSEKKALTRFLFVLHEVYCKDCESIRVFRRTDQNML